ncbi:MAG: class I SAM-dependent methyltransferase, partial [Acidobacteriota bacterium]
MHAKDSQYWDGVAHGWSGRQRQALWRRFCDRINAQWLRRALADGGGRALKTDLFDETTGSSELISELAGDQRQVFGIDLSPVSAQVAHKSIPTLGTCASDARRLPFSDRAFDIVLSNSTLDHMESLQDIAEALSEIHRVLRPGGRLLLTLDNLSNPVIALRARLPQRWLQA